jgi:hypothetical protein
MKAATKLLLSLRQNAEHVDVLHKKYRAAKINRCFQNSAFYSAANKDYEVVSGWLVGDDYLDLGTVFVPHYFLKHKQSAIYYDTSPTAPDDIQSYEYVLDMDIYRYANRTSYVPPPVIVRKNGLLEVRVAESNFVSVSEIDIQNLYALVRN